MKLIDLSDYNRPARIYWTVMVVAGAGVFGWAVTGCFRLSSNQGAGFAGLLALVVFGRINSYPHSQHQIEFYCG